MLISITCGSGGGAGNDGGDSYYYQNYNATYGWGLGGHALGGGGAVLAFLALDLVTRSARGDALADQAQAENALTGALKSLFAVAEAYPDLKANANFLSLQEELTSTEDRIAYARQFFNDSVLSYNTRIQTFPANLLAGMFGFTAREYFDGDPGDAAPVDVRF